MNFIKVHLPYDFSQKKPHACWITKIVSTTSCTRGRKVKQGEGEVFFTGK